MKRRGKIENRISEKFLVNIHYLNDLLTVCIIYLTVARCLDNTNVSR